VRVRQSDLEKYIHGGDATDPSRRPAAEWLDRGKHVPDR
jgi:hypothetical protein